MGLTSLDDSHCSVRSICTACYASVWRLCGNAWPPLCRAAAAAIALYRTSPTQAFPGWIPSSPATAAALLPKLDYKSPCHCRGS
eukprot:151317-Chlamydomonas_euryale.AAC.14